MALDDPTADRDRPLHLLRLDESRSMSQRIVVSDAEAVLVCKRWLATQRRILRDRHQHRLERPRHSRVDDEGTSREKLLSVVVLDDRVDSPFSPCWSTSDDRPKPPFLPHRDDLCERAPKRIGHRLILETVSTPSSTVSLRQLGPALPVLVLFGDVGGGPSGGEERSEDQRREERVAEGLAEYQGLSPPRAFVIPERKALAGQRREGTLLEQHGDSSLTSTFDPDDDAEEDENEAGSDRRAAPACLR